MAMMNILIKGLYYMKHTTVGWQQKTTSFYDQVKLVKGDPLPPLSLG